MELTPDTTTGVLRCEVVPSPTCAALKASQPHHKPTHPASRSPLSPSPQIALAPPRSSFAPNTISLQTSPQSHTCVPADERVSSKYSSPSRMHIPHSIPQHITPHPCMPQHRSTPSHTARTPRNTHQHHNQSNWRAPLHAYVASAQHKHAPTSQASTPHNTRSYISS